MIMENLLNEKMLQEIFTALEKGETFKYSDGNISMAINPNGISLKYITKPNKDKEVQNFLNYCDSIDSDLFVEACESFSGEELNELQNNLDTDDYRRTIKIFTERIKDIAKKRLEEICDYADSEIRTHELTIEMAQKAIANIHQELEESIKKYTV